MMRTVVVTGGTSGIGRAIARRFAAQGDAVVIVGRRPDRVEETAEALGVRGEVVDVTAADAVAALASRLPDAIDVIIAMAGGNTDIGRETPAPDDAITAAALAWTDNLRLNTIGTALAVTALAPKLRPGGSVITVSSIGAEYAATSYGAAKAAVAAWTAGISARLGAHGITANCISPGYIEDTGFFADSMTPARRERLIAATHTARAGTPDDVAGLAWFLAGPDARQITGQTIHLNGGAHTTR